MSQQPSKLQLVAGRLWKVWDSDFYGSSYQSQYVVKSRFLQGSVFGPIFLPFVNDISISTYMKALCTEALPSKQAYVLTHLKHRPNDFSNILNPTKQYHNNVMVGNAEIWSCIICALFWSHCCLIVIFSSCIAFHVTYQSLELLFLACYICDLSFYPTYFICTDYFGGWGEGG